MSYLWEIETGQTYAMRKKNDIFSGLGEDASDIVVYATPDGEKPKEDPNAGTGAGDKEEKDAAKSKEAEEMEVAKQERLEKRRLRQAASRARNIVDMLENIKVFPVSGGVDALYGKQKFASKFDIAYVSQHGCHQVGDDSFPSILKPSAKVVLETGKHVYALKTKQCEELTKKMFELTEKQGWKFMEEGGDKGEMENFVFRT